MNGPTWQVIEGDALQELQKLPAASVHCCITSPPYWCLRDYKLPAVRWPDGWSGALGLEPTMDLYVGHLVLIFHELARVLRPDGVLWLNLGDTYSGENKGNSGAIRPWDKQATSEGSWSTRRRDSRTLSPSRSGGSGLKAGDLCGIPWRVAMALQADGWVLRSSVIWFKPGPMPESVNGWRWERCQVKVTPSTSDRNSRGRKMKSGWTIETHPSSRTPAKYADCPGCSKCRPNAGLILRKGNWRPTRTTEYIFLLSRGDYYGDREAVCEPAPNTSGGRLTGSKHVSWAEGSAAEGKGLDGGPVAKRNLRNVWLFSTEPFKGPHYAAFPSELPRRCITASTSERGVCQDCGAPWARVVDQSRTFESGSGRSGNAPIGKSGPGLQGGGQTGDVRRGPVLHTSTTGWRATCRCNTGEPIPATVLDPFAGTGTTGAVALALGRSFIGIELSPAYVRLAERRISRRALAAERRGETPAVEIPAGPLFTPKKEALCRL